jgi:hypothetical protein
MRSPKIAKQVALLTRDFVAESSYQFLLSARYETFRSICRTRIDQSDRPVERALPICVLFGRVTGTAKSPYVVDDMIHVLDIDPRVARRCLRAGRLQAGA